MADPLPRLYERGAARFVEYRVPAVERDLGRVWRLYRVARHAVDRVLPALSIVYIRYFVKEPPIWVENRRRQLEEKREVRAPLIKIFQRGMLGNTLLACWWMASNFILYYSIWALFCDAFCRRI